MATQKGVRHARRWEAHLAFVLALAVAGCGPHEGTATHPAGFASATAPSSTQTDQEKVLNVYNWIDYIDPTVIPAFEREYGLKVNYDVFDSNQVLETKLLTGKSGYDVVVPTAQFLQRQIPAGVYQKLDKTLLPNLKNLDAGLSRSVEVNDPGNQYGVIYFWGTAGIGYDAETIAAAMPTAPVDSFAMLYDPGVVKHFKDCGVSILDAADEVIETVLVYLGKDPDSESLVDLKSAEEVLLSIRPYVRYIDSSSYIGRLANGDICLMLAWNGDVAQARARAAEAGRSVKLGHILPKEGAIVYFDMLAIPADATHVKNGHLFINYLLRPDVAAKNSSSMRFATANAAAYKLIDPAVYSDQIVYPRQEQLTHRYPLAAHSLSYARQLNRTWTRFKTGR